MVYRHGNIPDHSDKIMFAEDAVTWFMDDYFDEEYKPLLASRYREFIYEAFNPTIKSAMITIYEQVCMNIDSDDEDYPPTRRHYKQFARNLRRLYFKEGLDPQNFLLYLIYLLSALPDLINLYGAQKAGDLAVLCILKALNGRDMFCGGWDTLHAVAQSIENIEEYADRHSPDERLALELRNVNRPSSSSDEQDSNAEDLDANDGSNNLGQLRTSLEVNQVDAKRQEVVKASDVMLKPAFFSPAKRDDIDDNLKTIEYLKLVEKFGTPSPSSHMENNKALEKEVPIKDVITPEYENERFSGRKPTTKMDNDRLNAIKIELSSLVASSRFGLTLPQTEADSPQTSNFSNSASTSDSVNELNHLKNQSQKQEHAGSIKVPRLGLMSRRKKNKVNLKHSVAFNERSVDHANNHEQVRTLMLPSRDYLEYTEVSDSSSVLSKDGNKENPKEVPFANSVPTSEIENHDAHLKTQPPQLQDHSRFVQVPGLSLISMQNEEMNLKHTSTCNAQSPDCINKSRQRSVFMSQTRDRIKLVEMSQSIPLSSKLKNVHPEKAVEEYLSPDFKNSKVCLGDNSLSQRDKELMFIPLLSLNSSQDENKECLKTDYRVKNNLVSDIEHKAMQRSSKRDHEGSAIFKNEQIFR